ncbi:MAG: hypothetical protein LBL36_01740 [Clostridiales Family XIII bacterium]|jgi:hypothetical protein|nr:hypothetical protein [Clostridiales Family XIII bacterium]
MIDYNAIAERLTSAEEFLSLTDEPGIFGAKKNAQAAYELWNSADQRFVGAVAPIPAPGGTGSGLVIYVHWNPAEVTPDLDAIQVAINTSLPVKMIRGDGKATWKGRDKKQIAFFVWQDIRSRELCQWFLERFGVYACTNQVMARSDFDYNVAVVAVKDGVDHLWTLTMPK